ncbi:MAG: hypothetical protein ACRENE_21580 [Polyangiaceae bacterium]
MPAGATSAVVLASAIAAMGAAGCFGDTSTAPTASSGGGSGYAPVYGSSSSGGSSTSSSSGSPSGQPLLAVVDTGQTLTAPAGQGVGVFIEYQTGGHWLISWTCDTELTGHDCPFALAVDVMSGGAGPAPEGGAAPGTIANVVDQLTAADGAWRTPNADELSVSTTTTTNVDAIGFDTYPGATITLTVTLSGVENGSFLFFVQDGKVNGGYKGILSDPLMLVASTP